MSLSETAVRASLAQQTGEVFLAYLKIEHESFAEPIRIVNNNAPITRADGEYMPWPFAPDWPDSADDTNVAMRITIDNIDTSITKLIRDIVGAPPTCEVGVMLANTPDVVEFGPYKMSIVSATYDQLTIAIQLGREEDPMNLQVPRQRYIPSNSPGLWS